MIGELLKHEKYMKIQTVYNRTPKSFDLHDYGLKRNDIEVLIHMRNYLFCISLLLRGHALYYTFSIDYNSCLSHATFVIFTKKTFSEMPPTQIKTNKYIMSYLQ